MQTPVRVITYDAGTTGIKTCLFEIDGEIRLVDSETEGYPLYLLENGGAEQDPHDWWSAMCSTTRRLLHKTGTAPENVSGISFCSQMQGLVLVDRNGRPVRRAMSYMDQRAGEEIRAGMAHGIRAAGVNIFKLLKSLRETGAVAASVKDPVWKYKWVEKNEPAVFACIHRWLDVKEYLVCRCTGEMIMTEDSAFATLLYGIREGKKGWSRAVCRMLGVDMEHLPEIKKSTDRVGAITAEAASGLGLAEGTAVFGGGGDASLVGVGAGAVSPGDTHIYAGTSGWVSTVVERSIVDATAMIAAIVGAQEGRFNYFAELETAGKCLEWAGDCLVLDETGLCRQEKAADGLAEETRANLYDRMSGAVKSAPAGSGGVIFAPWLHGNRCPFEDPFARAVFFNIGLETGTKELIRAVVEGVCFHLRWMLEAQEKKVKTSAVIRFAGGGALSEVTCQILADILGRNIETVDNPQNVGAAGAAVVIAAGLGMIESLEGAKHLIPATVSYRPNPANRPVYDRNYAVFKQLHRDNRKNFAALNRGQA